MCWHKLQRRADCSTTWTREREREAVIVFVCVPDFGSGCECMGLSKK